MAGSNWWYYLDMKKIGKGVQYDVYDVGNGRVRKIESSFLQKIYRFHKIAPKYKIYSHPLHNIKTVMEAIRMTKQSIDSLRKHQINIDCELLGNPTIIDDNNYEQDFAITLGDVLHSSDLQKKKELIDKYIDNILACWGYGFSDTVFNFMINSGITSRGNVITTDLGELTFNRKEIEILVRDKHWEKRSSFNKLKDIDLKNYIREQFNTRITISNLDKLWNSCQAVHIPLQSYF